MRALRYAIVLAAIAGAAACYAWLAYRPAPPPAAAARSRNLLDADFQRSLPSRVTLLRRELTEPGLHVSRVAAARAGADQRLVYITGEVRKQGSYTLVERMTVSQAIEAAGGLTDRADRNRIHIVRGVEGRTRTLQAKPDDRLLADDVIQVLKHVRR